MLEYIPILGIGKKKLGILFAKIFLSFAAIVTGGKFFRIAGLTVRAARTTDSARPRDCLTLTVLFVHVLVYTATRSVQGENRKSFFACLALYRRVYLGAKVSSCHYGIRTSAYEVFSG